MPWKSADRDEPGRSTKASAGPGTCRGRAEPSPARDVVDHEHSPDHPALAQELAEFFVFRVRQVRVAGCHALERQLIDVGEPEVLPLRAVVDAVLDRGDAGNLPLPVAERF